MGLFLGNRPKKELPPIHTLWFIVVYSYFHCEDTPAASWKVDNTEQIKVLSGKKQR